MRPNAKTMNPVNYFWRLAAPLFEQKSEREICGRAHQAITLVRAYYAYLVYLTFVRNSRAVKDWLGESMGKARLDLDLPGLFPADSWPWVATIAIFVAFGGSLLAVAFPRVRLARIAAILGFIVYQSMVADLKGKVDHGHHAAIWVGIAFCFLPRFDSEKSENVEAAKAYLASFFGAQLMVALLYTCAGLCKTIGIFYDWPSGVTWFNAEAMPLTLAENWSKSKLSLFGGFLIERPLLGQFLNWSVLYLEGFTLLAIFRPRLHRYWGMGLVLMHFFIIHTMMIHFHESSIILLLLLVASPFAPTRFNLRSTLSDLPLIRGLLKLKSLRQVPPKKGKPEQLRSRAASSSVYVPPTLVQKTWIPLLVVVYLTVAFSRFKPEDGSFEEDIYPVAAMWMYHRIDSSERNVKGLARIRSYLKKRKTWLPKTKDYRKRSKKKKRRSSKP